jgi:cytidylate kinase
MTGIREFEQTFGDAREIRVLESCGSTNEVLRELAHRGAPAGTLVVAEAQTEGRGRLGRSWHSPPGRDLYASLLLRPAVEPSRAPLLGLAAAVAIVEVLNGPPFAGPEDPRALIKWPNDVVTPEGRKLAGLLAESELRGELVDFVVLGIGLNVNAETFPPELPLAESLLRWRGGRLERTALLAALVSSVEAWVERAIRDPGEVTRAWRAAAHTLGRRVSVDGIEGLARGIREDGALLVEEAGSGRLRVAFSGEILAPAYASSATHGDSMGDTKDRERCPGGLRVAVDGPAASGKGTIARNVARALGYVHLDTGSLYRALALMARERGVSWDDEPGLASLASCQAYVFEWDGQRMRLRVDGRDLSEAIRSEAIGNGAARVSRHPHVRAALLSVQQAQAERGGVVMDGRDIGSVVMPQAELKVFLDASPEERARRRWLELVERGAERPYEEILGELRARDALDSERAVAPLRRLPDSFYVDTTGRGIEEITAFVLREARRRGA